MKPFKRLRERIAKRLGKPPIKIKDIDIGHVYSKEELGESKSPRFFERLRGKGRFFSPERIKERHDFRIKVSANRKWIMIGLAVLAVCATIVYLSITYGGSVLKGLF